MFPPEYPVFTAAPSTPAVYSDSKEQMSEKGWGYRTLNDGRQLPEIGYGSWLIGSGGTVVDQVEQAIEVGFSHIGTSLPRSLWLHMVCADWIE